MSLTWIIVLSVYALVVSVLVFWYFGTKAPDSQREFWTILITWVISLVFGPFIFIAFLYGVIKSLVTRKK